MKAPSIFPFIRIGELRHETIHDRHATSLSPDSVNRCHRDRSCSTSGYRPVRRFRRRVYIDDLSRSDGGGHCVHGAGHKTSRPRRVCFGPVPPSCLLHGRTWQRRFGIAACPVQMLVVLRLRFDRKAIGVGQVLAVVSSKLMFVGSVESTGEQ